MSAKGISARCNSWRRSRSHLVWLCWLLACGSPTPSPQRVEPRVDGSPVWLVGVTRVEAELTPFGDGLHAWVWRPDQVFYVDKQGQRTPREGSLLAPGSSLQMLIQTELPGRAWLLTRTEGAGAVASRDMLRLLEARQGAPGGQLVLEADRILRLREQPRGSLYDVNPELPSLRDRIPHSHLWVVLSREGKRELAAIDTQGKVLPPIPIERLGQPGEDELEQWQVVPVEQGPRVWLKAGKRLFFIDAEAQEPVSGPLLQGERILWVVPAPGRRAWVTASVCLSAGSGGARLFSVSATSPRAGSRLLLEGRPVRQIVPTPDGAHLWVALSTDEERGGGVLKVDGEGKSLLRKGSRLPDQEVNLVVLPTGRVWLLELSGDVYLADEEGRVVLSQPGALPFRDQGALDGAFTLLVGDGEDILVWWAEAFLLKAGPHAIQTRPLLEGVELRSVDVDSQRGALWLQSQPEGALYLTFLEETRAEERHLVLRSPGTAFVVPAQQWGYGWIETRPADFAYVPRSEVGATLTLSSGSLRLEPGGRVTLQGTLDLGSALSQGQAGDLDLHWPGRASAAEMGGVLEVAIWDPERPEIPVAVATRGFGPGAPPPRLDWHLVEHALRDRTWRVTFRYRDEVGTDARLVVEGVPFRAPLVEQGWFRTMLACVVASLLFIVPVVVLPRERFARRWLPLTSWLINVVGGSGMALAATARGLRIHFPFFVGVLFAEMLCLIVAGALSPAVLRVLATIRPFQWMIPLALNTPAMRRRFFADHVALVRRKIEAQRRQANDERYVSLPVELCPGTPVLPRPAAEPPESFLCSLFSYLDWRKRSHVLIESPGGRGKSALLREVVLRMLERFEQAPSLPLPLLCDAQCRTLEEAARGALESLPLDAELQQVLLRRGDYVLVVDGFSESALSLESIRAFLDGRYGQSVRLLLSSRPHPGLRQAVEGADRWLRAEPCRLDEKSLGLFSATYAREGSPTLDEAAKRACRGPDGTYLPILVRLAFLRRAGTGGSIAELYDAAFHSLLRRGADEQKEDSTLLARTSELCVRTYWATGIRSLRYRNAPEQELMQKLLRAGVLVPEGPGLQPEQVPGQVRFFHDSMQSYLTAVGLFAQSHEQPDWELLFRAAADPLFTRAKSELVPEAGSELFQMCLQVFGPEERLRAELVRQLEEWAVLHANDFSRGHIAEALPEPLRERFREHLQLHPELSAEHALRLVIQLCEEEPRSLGILYARIASLRWTLRQQRGGRDERALPAPPVSDGHALSPLH